MDTANGKRVLPYVLLVIVVAAFAYGLGAATMYLTEGKAPLLGAGGNTAQSNPGTGTGSAGQGSATNPSGGEDQQPAGLDQDMKPFWSTFNAVEDEFYGRPVDRQKIIYGATKGMMGSLGDDFSAFLTPQENMVVESAMQG